MNKPYSSAVLHQLVALSDTRPLGKVFKHYLQQAVGVSGESGIPSALARRIDEDLGPVFYPPEVATPEHDEVALEVMWALKQSPHRRSRSFLNAMRTMVQIHNLRLLPVVIATRRHWGLYLPKDYPVIIKTQYPYIHQYLNLLDEKHTDLRFFDENATETLMKEYVDWLNHPAG